MTKLAYNKEKLTVNNPMSYAILRIHYAVFISLLGGHYCLQNRADAQGMALDDPFIAYSPDASVAQSDQDVLGSEGLPVLANDDEMKPAGQASPDTSESVEQNVYPDLGQPSLSYEMQNAPSTFDQRDSIDYSIRFTEGIANSAEAARGEDPYTDSGLPSGTETTPDEQGDGSGSGSDSTSDTLVGSDNGDTASATTPGSTTWTPDNSIQESYGVEGVFTLTQADEDDLYINADKFVKHLVVSVLGTPKVVDGVEQAPTLNGAGEFHGFEVVYKGVSNIETVISLEGIKYFKDLVNNGDGNRAGGAITLYNGGSIVFENTGDPVLFTGNESNSTTAHAAGGAIFLTGGSSVSDLIANFDGNTVTVVQDSTTTRYARGGAIFVGKFDSTIYGYAPTTESSTIGNITGNFTNNSASFGGAIYMGEFGVIGHIEGNFINNTAEGEKQPTHTQGASGGALRTWKGTIGSLDSDFIGNAAIAHTGMAVGGAVSLDGTMIEGGITGYYEGNIAFSEGGIAQGGAYALKNQSGDAALVFTNTNFTNNIAATGTNNISNGQGGALFVENSSDIYIVADGEDVLISDNYVVNNASWNATTRSVGESDNSVRDYTALYVKGSTVTLQTAEGTDNTITINDGIRDDNSASTTSTLVVQDNSSERYGVKLNGQIGVDHLRVESGGVELGSFTHSDGSVSTGSFSNQSNLTVSANALVKTNADYLKNVGHVSLEGIGDNTAVLELAGGTLLSDINAGGARTGYIDVLEETTVAGASTFNADTVNVGDTFRLTDSTTVNVETLIFTGYGMEDVNDGGNQIIADNTTTFAFDMIELNFATADPGDIFELIVAAEGETIDIEFDYETVVFTVAGQELVDGRDYRVLKRSDGGVDVEILIKVPPPVVPEPSTTLLSLLSLGAYLTRRRRPRGNLQN